MSKQSNKTNGDGVARTAVAERSDSELGRSAAPLIPAGSITRMLVRDWKRVALVTVVVTVIAWSLAAMQPPRYRASALASVAPVTEGLQPNELLRGVEVLERRTIVATVAALASTAVTRRQVGAASGIKLEAAVLPNTNLFRVDVESGNPSEAAAIANRVPAVLGAQTRTMYKYYGVLMIAPATAPTEPFLPRTGRAVLAGLLIGLFLGLLAAYAPHWRAARRGQLV